MTAGKTELKMTFYQEQLDKYENPDEFVEHCMHYAALQIGMFLIAHPELSVQWIGNRFAENKEAGYVNLYVILKTIQRGVKKSCEHKKNAD